MFGEVQRGAGIPIPDYPPYPMDLKVGQKVMLLRPWQGCRLGEITEVISPLMVSVGLYRYPNKFVDFTTKEFICLTAHN